VGLCGVYRGVFGVWAGAIGSKSPPTLDRVVMPSASQPMAGGLLPIAPAPSPPHLTGATPANFKRQTIPHTTVAPLYDNHSQAGMAAATP